MKRLFAAFLFFSAIAVAQLSPPSGGGCVISGSQTSGYVLTATDSSNNCSWQTVGGASVSADTIKNAWYITDVGSANAITGTTTTAFPGAYAAGQAVIVKVAATNTNATTVNINSLGAKAVTKSGATALAAGNLVSGRDYLLIYDGTEFQVIGFTLLSADVPGTVGNAATATALAANGTNCSTGQPALGVDASGNAEGCTPITDAQLSLSDITTNDVSTSKHGFAPKLDNNSSHYLNGQGGWTTPAGGGGSGCVPSGSANGVLVDDGMGNCTTSSVTIDPTPGRAGSVSFPQGTATTAPTASVGFQAPSSVTTKYMMTLPAALSTGFLLNTGTTDPGTLSFVAPSGTGGVCLQISCVMTTPNLGTPSAAVLTNGTGLPVSTGISGLGTGVGTFLGTPSSANLAAALTDETGTGSSVFANSPTLVTPVLGTPASATLTNATGLPISTGVSGLGTGVATFLGTPSSANLAGALTDETGTGAAVFANSPTLVTPALGTPASATLTNATGLPISTGVSGLGAGVGTFLGTPSSSNLAAALTDETGTGASVFANSPTLVTPTLGVATATTVNKVTITPPATSSTLTIADGKTLTASKSITLDGTDSTTMTFPSTSSTIPKVVASGTSTLGTSSISSQACATVVTTSATGVLSTDAITWTPNASIKGVTGYAPLTTGGLSIAGYPTADNVNWDVCNWSGSSITPGSVTLNWRVVR